MGYELTRRGFLAGTAAAGVTVLVGHSTVSTEGPRERRNESGGSEVFVVREDNRAVLQPVRLGRVVDDHWLILDGIKSGDRVVVEGFQKFAAGDPVRPRRWRGRNPEKPQRAENNTTATP